MTQIDAIIAQMTLAEKAALCTGATAWTTTPVERLGVPEMFVADGPHGVRRVPDATSMALGALPATCFPSASATACSWNPTLLHRMGQALAEEAIALGVDVLLGPGVNMKRIPTCGRNFEYFSEDPFLAGELAVSLIDGIQSRGVGTSLKHYAANSQEEQRMTISAEVDQRTLREIYLPAFEAAVTRAQPWTVMCSYNRVNGVYASEHRQLLTEILKEEWGFEGLVVSDWTAVHDRVAALQAGLDLEMPGPRPRRVQAVIDAVEQGELAEATLDEAVRRILRIVFKAAATPKGHPFDETGHHALARQVAADSMVLLKNNGILPLAKGGRIAVIGRAAREAHFQGGGSSQITPIRVDSPLDELAALAGPAAITYCDGYPEGDSSQPALIAEAAAAAQAADVALLYIAMPRFKEIEGFDRTDLDLTRHQIALIQAVTAVQPASVVILNNGSAVAMSEWIDGAAAVLEAWMMGQAGGGAIADLLFGVVNPSGKLTETFPLRLADTPAYLNYPGECGQVRYGEGIFIGYRYYDAREQPVLFPFGHGLSYTTFEYSPPRVSAETFRDVDGVVVEFEVTNTGAVAGQEVAQVYVHDCAAAVQRPPKELKGFAKVALQPGETKTVAVPLDGRAFAYFHPGHGRWITEGGEFDILVGASSADLRGAVRVTLESTAALPSLLGPLSSVNDWLADPVGRVVIGPLFAQVQAAMQATFSAGAGGDDREAMDAMQFVAGAPLPELLEFMGDHLPVPPAVLIAGLLQQVHG